MGSSADPGPRAGRGRPRLPEVDARLESAVLSLLQGGGPAAVTMDAVAADPGVAKTTIYRRFANRAELLEKVLSNTIGQPGPVPEGSVRDKIRFALDRAWTQMTDILAARAGWPRS